MRARLNHPGLSRFASAIPVSRAGAKLLSAIKGIDFDDKGIVLISDILRDGMKADCSVLMGAPEHGPACRPRLSAVSASRMHVRGALVTDTIARMR